MTFSWCSWKILFKNVQDVYSRCLGSREDTKNKVQTVLVDTLYHLSVTIHTFLLSRHTLWNGGKNCWYLLGFGILATMSNIYGQSYQEQANPKFTCKKLLACWADRRHIQNFGIPFQKQPVALLIQNPKIVSTNFRLFRTTLIFSFDKFLF